MSLPWVKLWNDLLSDSTIQTWPPTQRWCWVGALLIASQSPTPGQLTDSSGDPLTVADISSLLNVSWHTAASFVDRATRTGKLISDDRGVLSFAKWSQRQQTNVAKLVDASLAGTSRDRRGIIAPIATAPLKDPARASEPGSDSDLLKDIPSAVPRDAGRRGRLPVSIYELERLSDTLRGADARTPRALASVLAGMSEHQLSIALERTRARGALNEAAYLVATLKSLREEAAAA